MTISRAQATMYVINLCKRLLSCDIFKKEIKITDTICDDFNQLHTLYQQISSLYDNDENSIK